VLLLRDGEPRIGPQPLFADPGRVGNYPVFNRFDYNACTNYPGGLGAEGPHKVTLTGCDVYEDRALYATLIDLSRITGKPVYKAEAEKALTWWFTKTLGPAGLYPWGEHLGWDFEYECPTYFQGPSAKLYGACYHEIKDAVPFLDFLAGLPDRSLLERYALGVWEAHYWDKEHAVYCRHGDYTGQDKRTGSLAGFPAHQGAHLRLWVETWRTTENPEVKRKMADILDTVLDVQIARARKYGFIPFTFDADLKGTKPRKSGQSDRLGLHARELAGQVAEANPPLAAKLATLATLLLGPDRPTQEAKPPAVVRDLSDADRPEPHAREIERLLACYKQYGDAAYLRAATEQARLAYVRFMDDASPLPKACERPQKTPSGEPFPSFYFRGASLMHAFALLGEELRRGNTP